MLKALIVEDEKLAAEHLVTLINRVDPDIEVLAIIDSIEGAVKWLKTNTLPDLIFLDIQLSDGLSFEIFSYADVSCPVIFTTAYEEYALKAFKVNSIDYLLKPIRLEDLSFAIEKYKAILNKVNTQPDEQSFKYKVDQMMRMMTNSFKNRFIVSVGLHLRSVETDKVNCFYSLGKGTFLLEENGKSYDIDYSLEQLEKLLDPQIFFRVSRQYIVNISAIKDIIVYSGRRYKLKIANFNDEDVLVSRSRINEFRVWLDR
ncbi:MAG: DNA-binding response regulator [Bacteroidales bacterium]|nr:MAG: DNA-binding response regulator [Bacteroidales bacterium]